MDRNTQGRGDTLAPRDGTNYFEKICLRGQISGCRDKAWAFERLPGFHLEGHDNKIFQNVPSRRDCEEKCLRYGFLKKRTTKHDKFSWKNLIQKCNCLISILENVVSHVAQPNTTLYPSIVY